MVDASSSAQLKYIKQQLDIFGNILECVILFVIKEKKGPSKYKARIEKLNEGHSSLKCQSFITYEILKCNLYCHVRFFIPSSLKCCPINKSPNVFYRYPPDTSYHSYLFH